MWKQSQTWYRDAGFDRPYSIWWQRAYSFICNFPNSFHDGKLPDYENYKGVIESYAKGNAWLQTMKVPYIQDVNNKICEGKISNFIRSSELNFNLDINKIVQDILSNDKIKCIMISGPSSSGKTTVTHRIANYLSI